MNDERVLYNLKLRKDKIKAYFGNTKYTTSTIVNELQTKWPKDKYTGIRIKRFRLPYYQ